MDSLIERIPPHNIDAERAVMGAMLLDKEAVAKVIEILSFRHFYVPNHQIIFKVIFDLFNMGFPVDLVTVSDSLRSKSVLEDVGGYMYLLDISESVPTTANVEQYARIVEEKYIRRELIRVSNEISDVAYENNDDIAKVIETAERLIFSIGQKRFSKDLVHIKEMLVENFENITEGYSEDGQQMPIQTGISTGIHDLDEMTNGLNPSDLIILAARPAMGKCLGKGTKVVMFDGTLKKVEDVLPGDLLMGDDSTPRTVLGTTTGQENMYWVHQNHGISYRVNESHILSLKRSRNEWRHKNGDVMNIDVRTYLHKSEKFKSNYKGYKVPVEFPEQPLPVEPYFLGIWLGDGTSASSAVTNTDLEVVNFLKSYATELSLQVTEIRQPAKATVYAITNKGSGAHKKFCLKTELREIGLLNNKHIPQEYISNSTENRLSLLAGLIDSDGHYNSEFNVYEIVQKNEKMARDIKYLCDTLGFKTSFRTKKATLKSKNYECLVYRIRISGDIDKIPVKVERKKARARKSAANWRNTGIKVEFDKFDDYYGFELDGNGLFLLEDMTVSHNTSFCLNLATNIAMKEKLPVCIFSLEMSKEQITQRIVCAEAEISNHHFRVGNIPKESWPIITNTIAKLYNAPVFIDDTSTLTPIEIRSKLRRLKAEYKKIGAVIIDYLQLMEDSSSENRVQEIAKITRSLKKLAREMDVPVIALSQLSRTVEQRNNKRPQLSDLRESGSIEQDADIVMFIYRDEYYNPDTDKKKIAELIIAKHRNGPVGTVDLFFDAKLTKFSGLEK